MFVSLIKFFPKLSDLFLQFLYSLKPRVIIDYRSIGDERCLCGVGEGAEILLNEGIIGVDAGYHQAVAISTY